MNRSDVKDAEVQELRELAHDIGSNVVLHTDAARVCKVRVDGLVFDTIEGAKRHCQEVA